MNPSQSSSGSDFDYLFKLLLIGNSGVGKSCMLMRYAENTFSTNFFNTIGVDFKIRSVNIEGKNVKLQIWDTAGQDRFRTITCSYYRGAQGIIVVYDVTDRESFEAVKHWMQEIDKYAQENVLKMIVGNKCDMTDKRKVTLEEGQDLASQYGVVYFECSAKSCSNIDLVFQTMAKTVMDKFSNNRKDTQAKSTKLNTKDSKNLNGGGSSNGSGGNSNNSCC